MGEAIYDRIGRSYAESRRADPRIAAQLREALDGARTVVNVGAGAGSYEPTDREVTAVEPSDLMIAQRAQGAAPVVKATAERLPFADDSFDAAMAILSDHHWSDRAMGLRELRRVARHRILVLNADPGLADSFWLTREYLPGFVDLIPRRYQAPGFWGKELRQLLGEVEVRPITVPHDCLDGFYQSYWRRPHAYLDQRVRDGISVFHRLERAEVSSAMERLGRNLEHGVWEKSHRRLLEKPELDVGLRLAIARAE